MKKKDWIKSVEAKNPIRTIPFTSISGMPVDLIYTKEDINQKELEMPGDFPYTRGIHQTLYRTKIWTMRQFAGFGTPADTNERFKYLLEHGQTGLSTAFDLPTLMGQDADDKLSEGEVGICGVSVSSLADMEKLFHEIPLDKVSTSMTINAPAAMILAFYIVTAQKQNVEIKNLRGTIQNDILKEYIAQKEWIYPPHPSMRIITDMFSYCSKEMPQFNPISISGYHIREAGSTAVQELAFTLADGFAYVEAGISAGLNVDDFAPKLSFFFNAHNDFFEEIAKYRAARKIWAKRMKNKYSAKNPRSWTLRFHTQTAGCSLTAQQPENNIVRTALQALAGVLGGTQSLHTNSMDETLALPSDKAVKIALRTQQIIAYETGVPNVVDPLGGSFYLESLTDKMEKEAEEYFLKIDSLGGVIPALENGFFQREIAESAYRYQQELDRKEKIIVGINDFVEEEEKIEIPILKISKEVEKEQIKNLIDIRNSRNNEDVKKALSDLEKVAVDGNNLMPALITATKVYATLGEICNTLKLHFGTFEEPAIF
ncbi:MAG: methylmalonyl-CoA mutase family protein [Bacteroidota bacterium]